MVIYFKGARNIFGTRKVEGASEILKESREHATFDPAWRRSIT